MSCNDGNKCTFNDGCTAKGCVGTPNLCDDGKACTIDLCKSEQGCVTWVNDAACEDYEPCTKDFCLEGSGCHHTPVPGPCKDGNLCTETACVGGKCTVVKLLCTCKVDSDCIGQSKLGLCQLPHCVNDKCEAQPGPQGQLCDDGVACTHPDVCFDGACGGTPDDKLCDDGIQCTKDLCKPPAGCVHIPDDGRCDDKNPCSKDYCDVLKGCLANKHPDGTACNVNGFCQQGVCQ
jgi:hypothetical protein